jgi:hypothetical protein
MKVQLLECFSYAILLQIVHVYRYKYYYKRGNESGSIKHIHFSYLVGWWCDGIELRTTCPVFHLLRNVVVRRSLLDMVWDLTWLWQICFVVVLRVFCFAGSGWPWWFSWWLWCCGEVLLLLLTVARIVAIHPTHGSYIFVYWDCTIDIIFMIGHNKILNKLVLPST